MDSQDDRRKAKRHQLSWKAAVVFDESDQRPTLYTQTTNLSTGGAAIVSDYGDLTGSSLTLLLGLESRNADAPKMLMVPACVVSTTRTPSESRYQHGLRFENLDPETVELLSQLLDAKGAVQFAGAENGQEVSMAPTSSWWGGRLAALRQRILALHDGQEKPAPKRHADEDVSLAIEKTYRYLQEFVGQLNQLAPEYRKSYSIAGVPDFDRLMWKTSQVTCVTEEVPPSAKLFERITLVVHLSSDRKLYATEQPPADEKLKNLLRDVQIEFTAAEEGDARGSMRTVFEIPCEVRAKLEMIGNFDSGKLLLRTRNIERFGMMDYELDPGAISDESLDELKAFILGERTHIGPLLLRKS